MKRTMVYKNNNFRVDAEVDTTAKKAGSNTFTVRQGRSKQVYNRRYAKVLRDQLNSFLGE